MHRQGEKRKPSSARVSIFNAVYVQKKQVKCLSYFFTVTKYEQALNVELPDTDEYRRQITDTYILWAINEKEFNYESEFLRLVEIAKGYCSRIGQKKMQKDMSDRIYRLENE